MEAGSFSELMSSGKAFARLIERHGLHNQSRDTEAEEEKHAAPAALQQTSRTGSSEPTHETSWSPGKKRAHASKPHDKLLTVEERESGDVSWSAYIWYVTSAGPLLVALVLFGYSGRRHLTYH